jgi:TonB family protein
LPLELLSGDVLDLSTHAFTLVLLRLLILILLSAGAFAGCQSPNWPGQTTSVREETAQLKVIPASTPAPAVAAPRPDLAQTNAVFGPYDSALVKAIQHRWDALLRNYSGEQQLGQAVVKFKLHADGSISDVTVASSNVNAELTQLLVSVVKDASPFAPWPDEMRQKIAGEFRQLTFTFRYY